MIKKAKRFFNKKRAEKISNIIYPFLSRGGKILDLGCGDMLVAESLKKKLDLEIVGIDVIDANLTSLPLKLYNGVKIPFDNKSFDITYISFVLHHTKNIEKLLSESIRITKKRIIILEDVYEDKLDLLMTKFWDFGNILTSLSMDLPLNFKREREWVRLFGKLKVKKVKVKKIYPSSLNLIKHRLFVLDIK
jgi:2-polyprenyl-3-methyl-5-hydroxy-6-metoxy-1,4-benzoquinol methylase